MEFNEKQQKNEEKRELFKIQKAEKLALKKQLAEEKNRQIKEVIAANEAKEAEKREVISNHVAYFNLYLGLLVQNGRSPVKKTRIE